MFWKKKKVKKMHWRKKREWGGRGQMCSRAELVSFSLIPHHSGNWPPSIACLSLHPHLLSPPFCLKQGNLREWEGEVGRVRATVALSELSEALRGNKQSNLLCFSTFSLFPRPLPPPVFQLTRAFIFWMHVFVCVHVLVLRQATHMQLLDHTPSD